MAASPTSFTVRLSEVEPFAAFHRMVTEADAAFRSLTKAEAEALPSTAAKGILLLQMAMEFLPLADATPGKAVPPPAGGSGPRDFSAEVGAHGAGRPKAGGQ